MKRIICLISIFIFCGGLCSSQTQFFSRQKMIETGVYYYPEAWSNLQWERDVKNIADMGFEFVHVGEFAWAMMEPSEGNFSFGWLEQFLDLCQKSNLKVIMGTPTATPPVWLTKSYPEVLLVLDNGLSTMHGMRAHYSWSSPKYRELTEKIVAAMAKKFGNDARIWGWQIDNEPSHYGMVDYNPATQRAFIKWLRNRYKTIDKLNAAWGTIFWSGTYNDFEQIELPNNIRLNNRPASPASLLDMKRFQADECADYVSLQNRILRKYISPKQFVTTNYMSTHFDVDPWKSTDLDFISYTIYPATGYTDGVGEHGFRMSDSWRISLANDMFMSLNGVTGTMELQPGQVNGGKLQPYPGVIRSWLWQTFAGGQSFVCTYRYRQPLSGYEQTHAGIVGTDGITPSQGGGEFAQFIKEMRHLRGLYRPDVAPPAEYVKRKTAMVYNIENTWEASVIRLTMPWDQFAHFSRYYDGLKQLSVPVDVVDENRDLSSYPFAVVAAYQLTDAALIAKWQRYVDMGGHLIVSCRTGTKDRNGNLPQRPWAESIRELIGAKIEFYDPLLPHKQGTVASDGELYKWNSWAEIIEPDAKTEVWATYNDQFYKGRAAVVHKKSKRGTVTYVGVDTRDGALEQEILRRVFAIANCSVNELPDGVIANWRDGFWVVNNYSSSVVKYSIPNNGKAIVGSEEIVPGGVLVWQ